MPEAKNYTYDVFIGYHGTFNSSGSLDSAKAVANYLQGAGYRVYLHRYAWSEKHPAHKDTAWNSTWERIAESKTFLLVVNDLVPRRANGALGDESGRINQLRSELDCFYDLVSKGERDKHDFNFSYAGDIKDTEKKRELLDSLYRPLTTGHNDLIYDSQAYQPIKTWLNDRLSSQDQLCGKPKSKRIKPDFDTDDLVLFSVKSFSEAYERACSLSQNSRHNLLVRISLSSDDFMKPFPYRDALASAEKMRRNAPAGDEALNAQFSLYHGDYIRTQDDGARLDGYQHVIDELKKKRSSRRALLSLISTEHIVNSGNLPIPSYMVSQFQICADTLYVTEYFRAMEVHNFFPINLGEAYLFIKEIVFALPDIKQVALLFHIFEAYVSKYPVLSLYIPIMDRPDSESILDAALKARDNAKLIELLEDKAYSKKFDYFSGFERMDSRIREYRTYPDDVSSQLAVLIRESRELKTLYDKSNNPQAALVETIDGHIKELIALLRKDSE